MRPGAEFRVSAIGLAGRLIGNLLWQALPGDRHPVTSVVRENGDRSARHRGSGGMVALLPWLLIVPATVWVMLTSLHFQRIGADCLRNPAGASMHETALRLRAAGTGWWRFLHPTAAARVRHLAGLVEAGSESLRATAREREAAARELADLGPVRRLRRGATLTAAARAQLASIDTPWHRETFAFRELSHSLEPYERSPEVVRLDGQVTALPPGRAIQFAPLTVTGTQVHPPTEPLHPGASFDFTSPPDGLVLITELEAIGPSRIYRVVGDLRLDLSSWSERPIALPGGSGQLQVRFGPAAEGMAPPLTSLSPQAQVELAVDAVPTGD